MAIQTTVNYSGLNSMKYADSDADPVDRATQVANAVYNLDLHDHTSGKGLGVGRVQTTTAPSAAGMVQTTGDAFRWWGASAGAVRTAVDLEGAQTIAGAKTFSAAATFSSTVAVATGITTSSGGYARVLGPVYAGIATYAAAYDNPFGYSRGITAAIDTGTAGAQDAGLTLVGRRTTDARFAAISFYNSPSGTTVNHMAQIHADRAGADNTGSLTFATMNAGVLTDRLTIDAAGDLIQAGGYHAIGTNPAGVGTIRLANAATVAFRNGANSADLFGAYMDSANVLYLGTNNSATTPAAGVTLMSTGVGTGHAFTNTTAKFTGIGTTASAANAFIDGAAANNLLRSTSSLRYKNVRGDLPLAEARALVLGLRPITYTSTAAADDPARVFVGFAAEHVHELDARFVTHDAEGRPDWVQYPSLVVPLAAVVGDHETRLARLEARA